MKPLNIELQRRKERPKEGNEKYDKMRRQYYGQNVDTSRRRHRYLLGNERKYHMS